MIDLYTAEVYHNQVIDNFGGSRGIRDEGSLLAALARPYATFDEQDLYPTPVDKAAAIFESLIINHAFVDGNKRIAYVLMRLTLMNYYVDVMAFEDEKYKMTISASTGEIRFDEIKAWIEEHIVQINP
ncbi:type II toxin-antitoxin system death-on-curing family toxin [Mucilaginibacter antarcticus]|uniref:Type II toxin-antitoxin system death-on-curing family toxin n=1 Tax=Mucilaginibacter antarcticus TaxID=1855725 RepID=A0ABW5XMK8_9SPHI